MKIKIPDEAKRTKMQYYQKHTVEFMTEVLDVSPANVWDKMEEIAYTIRDHRKVAVKAGHSVSKSFTTARLALWYLYCFAPCTVITTAPTNTQVEEILWREIRQAHANAKMRLGGHITQTKLDLSNVCEAKKNKWFAFGFSTRADTVDGNATKMQGFHNKNVLIIFDEADGILPPIWDAADGLLTTEGTKLLAIGNPMRPTGNFADCFKDSSFKHITISVKDTPNYKQGREVIPGVSGVQYEQDMAKKWGVDSDMYKSRVLGEIPDSDPEAIVPVSWYERAEGRKLYDISNKKRRYVTVDVADGGNDDSVVYGWENKTQVKMWRYPSKRADEIDGDVLRNLKEINGNTIIYDHCGCGRILGGLLTGLTRDMNIDIIAFDGGAEAYDEDFDNRRAEAHHLTHKDFKNNTISLLPNNPKLKEDLTSVRWGEPRKGKITVEPKKLLKKRISHSPDDGDNVVMMSACYEEIKPVEVGDMYLVRRKSGRSRKGGWKAA